MAAIAAELGTPLMPWQRLVADVALEIDDDGKLVYREVGLTVPRQSGKTTLLLSVMVDRALFFEEPQRIVYTAQTRNDARRKWEDDQIPMLRNSPFGSRFTVRKANGGEAIRWHNGSLHALMATTPKSGHGSTLDLAVIDEAFAQVDDRLEQSTKPARITRRHPQTWVVSTAGTAESKYLLGKVEAGRQLVENDVRKGVCYFEWSAPDDADPSDPATWRACMPALGHTISEDAIAADFMSMALPEFERAYLNRWTRGKASPVIPEDVWAALASESLSPEPPFVFAFDVAPGGAFGGIVVCGPGPTLEVIDSRPGTAWMPARLAELAQRWNPGPFACDPSGPAGALIPTIDAMGLPLHEVSGREYSQACELFFDKAMAGTLHHRGEPVLATAVGGAVKRLVGDLWAWSRTNSAVDISPLVAATLAVWGVEKDAGRPFDASLAVY